MKKISSQDIIFDERIYLDSTHAKITISNLGSSVSYSIQGLNDENYPERLLDFVNAAKKILTLAELSIFDLR